jgi:hypothetical protein
LQYQSWCADRSWQRRHSVHGQRKPHEGHTPLVWKVFQTWKQVHCQRSEARGRHSHFGQRTRRNRSCSFPPADEPVRRSRSDWRPASFSKRNESARRASMRGTLPDGRNDRSLTALEVEPRTFGAPHASRRRTTPAAMHSAATMRPTPNRSFSTMAASATPKRIDVSRSAATGAIGARVIAHSAIP